MSEHKYHLNYENKNSKMQISENEYVEWLGWLFFLINNINLCFIRIQCNNEKTGIYVERVCYFVRTKFEKIIKPLSYIIEYLFCLFNSFWCSDIFVDLVH